MSPQTPAGPSLGLFGVDVPEIDQIGISRNDQLRIIGNGVVPQQAIAALRYLLSVCEVAA